MAIIGRARDAGNEQAAGESRPPGTTMVVAQHRRRLVEILYQSGTPIDDIVESLKPQFPSANRRNIESDIHIIRSRWKEQVRDVFGSDVRSWFVYTALGDRRRAIEAGNLQLAYSISRDLAKLAGVNLADLTVEHSARSEDGTKTVTFLELMQEERRRKQLPPADFEVIRSEPLTETEGSAE